MQQVQANHAALLEELGDIKEKQKQEKRDLSAQILQDPTLVREAASMQHRGHPVADMLMREGQMASAARAPNILRAASTRSRSDLASVKRPEPWQLHVQG